MKEKAELKGGSKHGTYKLRYGVECYDKYGEIISSPEPWGDGWKMPASGNKKPEKQSLFSKEEINELYESVDMKPRYKK